PARDVAPRFDRDPSPAYEPAPSADAATESETEQGRRVARRRPAGPVRQGMAANDDAPTIGGLIFALEQKPSNRPFVLAGVFSGVWGALGTAVSGLAIYSALTKGATVLEIITQPTILASIAAIGLPIGVVWFLALLAWRSEELRLRSSTMTEVAVRLAEPDRMAEQAISSLGQNVRRQVSFMNDAVSRALGRAGELEALVHSEVAALDRSYEENEKRIRGLIQELSGERHALLNTSERVAVTLRTLGSEVPGLIDKLSDQQIKLSEIIAGAGRNLNALETAMNQSAGQLETTLGSRTTHLQKVLENYSTKIDVTMGSHTEGLDKQLTERSEQMQNVLEGYTTALATVLSSRSEEMQAAFEDSIRTLDSSLGNRTENLQTVFEEYALALDTTLQNRAQALDLQLVDRTASLDAAFAHRLELFDESIQRSTSAIDGAVSERATALTTALDTHAKTFRETVARQAGDLDESLMQGINAVRRSSENITRQSLKAIEGLANQSDMLKNVSENLLGQINSVTNRFENQGQQIMKAANALESANYKIDSTLKSRHSELSRTLEQITGTTDNFGKVITSYSSSIEESVAEAERRARQAAEELRAGAEHRSRAAMAEIEQLRSHTNAEIEQMRSLTNAESERALDDVRRRFSSATGEVQQQIGSLSQQVSDATLEVRNRSALAAAELADEQARLKAQLSALPVATRESTDAMRRSLHDQLQALDKLNQLTNRTAQLRDVSPPAGHVPPPYPNAPFPNPPPQQPGGHPDMQRALSSLMPQMPVEQPSVLAPLPPRPAPRPPMDTEPPQGWSFGDLLARASKEEDVMGHHPQPPVQEQRNTPFQLNVGVIARALDAPTADALWSRLRAGQRGIMVRSIYAPEGRIAFDEISRRAKVDPDLENTIGRYLADFERILKDAEARDPSGRMLQQQLVSDTGRVYLFLAHATGRLA
ncbi:MAG: hypothetical protein ABL901_06645, partial [Hyphomicrobiaceae bacterium]